MISKDELKRQINEIRDKLEIEWRTLDQIFEKVKNKHIEIDEFKSRRDEFNQLVKTRISDALDKQKERDKLQESTRPKREVIKNLRLNIKEYAKHISELKDIRDGKHREAKGSRVGLKDNIAGSLTTLLNLELSLKDEITLFNMIFSSQERYQAKIQADDIHNQIQELYDALKQTERQVDEEEANINKIFQESQILHNESISKFKDKDDARENSNSLHQQVLSGYKEIKELRFQADEVKRTVTSLKNQLDDLHKKLRASDRKRKEMAHQEKLDTAKQKLKGEKKMDLNELRLLIESGTLKK